jgi:hypothetical protein
LRVQLDEVTLQLNQLQTKLAEFSDNGDPDAQVMEE